MKTPKFIGLMSVAVIILSASSIINAESKDDVIDDFDAVGDYLEIHAPEKVDMYNEIVGDIVDNQSISGSQAGEVLQQLNNNNYEEAKELATRDYDQP